MVANKQELKKNKVKDVAAKWGEAEKDVMKFMVAMERQSRTIPGVGGPRKMVIRDRTDHRTGLNLMLNPDAEEIAHELYLKQQARKAVEK